MKRVLSYLIAWMGFCSLAYGHPTTPDWSDPSLAWDVPAVDYDYILVEEEVKTRLESMPCLVQPKYNAAVRAYVSNYLVRNRENSERILGRAVLYFPLFEKYLEANHMPSGLKFLPVLESALNPKAVSRVGATGLWQFMESTGKIYGLDVNWTVDERSDPEKSTIAAIQHLGELYQRFDSWELALAAYNSGAGRVSRAIKRSRSKNFWKLQRYLPKETRNYVPAFIAATYLMQYYYYHQLNPSYPSLDLQFTESMQVEDYISFFRVAQITGIPLEIIELLNPSYPRGYIPANEKGNSIVLPKRVMPALRDFLALQGSGQPEIMEALEGIPVSWDDMRNPDLDKFYLRSIYIVNEGETIEKLAQVFQVPIHNLMAWNEMATPEIQPGQELVVYHIKDVKRYLPEAILPTPSIPALAPQPAQSADPNLATTPLTKPFAKGRYLCYRSNGLETLHEIMQHVGDISLQDILELNNINPNNRPKPGDVIKLKKM
ncbi:MAG: transglycosylase SLT domain-containing protein [Saprospirales bacterium]|nr:transglycosylase SLT domain-containing protein [Saprospirales bacterium]